MTENKTWNDVKFKKNKKYFKREFKITEDKIEYSKNKYDIPDVIKPKIVIKEPLDIYEKARLGMILFNEYPIISEVLDTLIKSP